MFLPSFSKATPARALFSRKPLSRMMMGALLVVVAAGCSNNAADATSNTGIVNSANAKVSTVQVADNDAAVVKALQANLKASGIEEEIISADSILPSLPIRKRTMDTPSILLLRSLIGYFGVGLFTILGGIAGLL